MTIIKRLTTYIKVELLIKAVFNKTIAVWDEVAGDEGLIPCSILRDAAWILLY